MSQEELLFDKIEDYLAHRLPPEAARAFEVEISKDANLAELVEQHRAERAGLRRAARKKLTTQMKAWEQESGGDAPESPPNEQAPRRSPLLAWIAGVLILALAGWGLWHWMNSPQPPPPQQNEIQQPAPPVATIPPPTTPPPATPPAPKKQEPRRDYIAMADKLYQSSSLNGASGIRGDARVDSAAIHFQKGRYSDAIRLLSDTSVALSISGQELLGHAYYKNRQFSKAAASLGKVAEKRKRPYSERSEWAQCLSLLAQLPATKTDFEVVLEKIAADNNHAYFQQAKALRQTLPNRK